MTQNTQRAPTLESAMEMLELSQSSTYSVAWIDCLADGENMGRSIVFTGEHARLSDLDGASRKAPFVRNARKSLHLPVDLPGFALGRLSVKIFNAVYFRSHSPTTETIDFDPYFYPLDSVTDWNRMYGSKGFVQYQCVLPQASSRKGLSSLLRETAKGGNASFLAVLKKFGKESIGHLSFPCEGYTLAMDFPATAETLALFARFDRIVAEGQGRIYLAKDACMTPEMFRSGYPRLDQFRDVRKRYGVEQRFVSDLSTRLRI